MDGVGSTLLTLLLGAVIIVLVLVLSRRVLWPIIVAISSTLTIPLLVPVSPVTVLSGTSVLRLTRDAFSLLTKRIPLLLILQLVIYALALLWSSNVGTGISAITTTATLVLLILVAHSVSRTSGTDLLRSTAYAMAPMAAVQSIATIVFRLSPRLEHEYLRSQLALFLLGDEARLLFTSRPNNVTDPLKAGGLLFVNGNRASMVMAVIALTFLALWMQRRGIHLLLLFGLCMAGAVMTGSKTAIVLAAVVPLFFLLLPAVLQRKVGSGTRALTLSVMIAGAGVAAMLVSRLPDYLVGVDRSTEARQDLLHAAYGYFREHPVSGLGFGGWAQRWASNAGTYGLGSELPPHNFLVLEWANAGIVAVVILVIVLLTVLASYLRMVRRSEQRAQAGYYSMLLAALVWIVAHGMFDNTAFFGTAHILPLFAVLIVLTFDFAPEPGTGSVRSRQHPSHVGRTVRTGEIRR